MQMLLKASVVLWFCGHTHFYNTLIMEPMHFRVTIEDMFALFLSHLLTCNEKTTDQGPLSVSWQQLYELRRQEKRAMEKRERACGREEGLLCSDKMVFSLRAK